MTCGARRIDLDQAPPGVDQSGALLEQVGLGAKRSGFGGAAQAGAAAADHDDVEALAHGILFPLPTMSRHFATSEAISRPSASRVSGSRSMPC